MEVIRILYIITHTYPELQRKYNSYEMEFLYSYYKDKIKILSFSKHKDYSIENVSYIKNNLNIKFFRYIKDLTYSNFKELFKQITSLNMALNIIKNHNITASDKVFGYWLTRPSIIAYYISLFTGAELYIQGHGSDVFINLPVIFDKMYKQCEYCFTVGNKNAKYLSKQVSDNSKIKISFMGVNDLDIKKKVFNEDKFTFIAAGHFYRIKGFDILIEALSMVDKKKCKLLLVGDGPEKKSLQNLARRKGVEDNIQFIDWVDEKELLTLMSDSDAYILSSRSEGLPIVLMQACSVGLPLICTNVGSVSDIAKEGKNAMLIEDYEKPNILAQCINDFMKMTSENKKEMGNYSYHLYKSYFNLNDNLLNKYRLIFE